MTILYYDTTTKYGFNIKVADEWDVIAWSGLVLKATECVWFVPGTIKE